MANYFSRLFSTIGKTANKLKDDPSYRKAAIGEYSLRHRLALSAGYVGAYMGFSHALDRLEESKKTYYGEERANQYYGNGFTAARGPAVGLTGLMVYGAIFGRDPISRALTSGKLLHKQIQRSTLSQGINPVEDDVANLMGFGPVSRKGPIVSEMPFSRTAPIPYGRGRQRPLAGKKGGVRAAMSGNPEDPRPMSRTRRQHREDAILGRRKQFQQQQQKEFQDSPINPDNWPAPAQGLSIPHTNHRPVTRKSFQMSDHMDPQPNLSSMRPETPVRTQSELNELHKINQNGSMIKERQRQAKLTEVEKEIEVLSKSKRLSADYLMSLTFLAIGGGVTNAAGPFFEELSPTIAKGAAVLGGVKLAKHIKNTSSYLGYGLGAGLVGATYYSTKQITQNMTAEGTITDISVNSPGGVSKMNYSTAGLVFALHNANRRDI